MHEVGEQLEAGPGGTVFALLGFTWLIGLLALGIGLAWRGIGRAVRGAGVALIASTAIMLVYPGLPGVEGLWIIPSSVIASVALATIGFATLPPTAVESPQPAAVGAGS
jgi:MFS superfamily sulfate permease-like transporter